MNIHASYCRPEFDVLIRRITEPRRFIQILTGARQVGKTTLVRQVMEAIDMPLHYASADEALPRSDVWIAQQWEIARLRSMEAPSLLIIDEIQKLPAWSDTVKRLWDGDTHAGRDVRVIVLGSAPLLMQHGMTESLAGRFETLHLPHWSLAEMSQAFGWQCEQYIFYGGYPGAAALIDDGDRWKRYIRDSLIETSISRDILMLTRIDKPVLLRRVFELGCRYSARILSYTKMLGQLQDAGNTTTLAHYLDLLAASGLLSGLQKFAGEAVRRRASSPKLQVFNNALISAQSGYDFGEALRDPVLWGRLAESAVGAHLLNAAASGTFELYYWREGDREVDFVIRKNNRVTALEVKSGRHRDSLPGMERFNTAFHPDRMLLIGGDGIPVQEFLMTPVEHWVA
jgi:uncharacterized protein